MKYISIDGDDIGRKITSCYLRNDRSGLTTLSTSLQNSTQAISMRLKKHGFEIIFCAADGVVASTELDVDFKSIFWDIIEVAPNGVTFSAGSGTSLRESYIALLSAKSNGKNCLHEYSELVSPSEDSTIV